MRVLSLIAILLLCSHSKGLAQIVQTPLLVEGSLSSYGQAASIDGEFAAVGSGCKVHVFRRQNNEWLHIDTLPDQEDCSELGSGLAFRFGFSVSLEGNLLAIGAPGYSARYPWQTPGAVYTYVWNGTKWAEAGILQDDVPQPGDNFGWDVDLDKGRLLIGAPHSGLNQSHGFVYLFERKGTGWSQTAKLTASNILGFGTPVSIEDSVIVAGVLDQANEFVAYVYEHNSEGWTEKTILKASNDDDALFTSSVDVHKNRIAVGASGYAGPLLPGAIYIYSKEDNLWQEEERISPTGANISRLGVTVLLRDDYLIASAVKDCGPGAVEIYRREAGSWIFFEGLVPESPEFGKRFGSSVDYDGQNLIIGATGSSLTCGPELSVLGEATVASYVIQPTGTQEDERSTIVEHYTVSAYPNPTPSNVIFKLDINKPGYVQIELFDTMGRKVALVSKRHYELGVFKESWDGSEFADGIYFYRISHERSIKTGKFVLNK